MIANFFNKTKPINFLVLSILVFIIFSIALGTNFSGDLNLLFFVKKGFLLFLAILIIFILNFIIRKNTLSDDNSYAIFFYILFFGFFPFSFSNGKIFIANFILLFAFRRIYSLRSNIKTKEKIFDSVFWIGIASLFYIWNLIYLLLLYSAIWIFRKDDWRNVFIPLIGFITPVIILYTYLLLINDVGMLNEILKFDYSLDFQNYITINVLLPLSLLFVMVAISILPTTKKSLLAKIDFKSTWIVLIIHIILSLLIVLIAPNKNGSEFIFLFFPLSVLFANFLQNMNKYWYKEVVLYLFIAMFFGVYLL